MLATGLLLVLAAQPAAAATVKFGAKVQNGNFPSNAYPGTYCDHEIDGGISGVFDEEDDDDDDAYAGVTRALDFLLRLDSALRELKPVSPREFLALATLQIRRELIDLARRFYGPHGIGANQDSQATVGAQSPGPAEQADLSHEPVTLAQWAELHEQIASLPEAEREVVELLFYQGLPQAEAAEILGVSVRTVQRCWHNALWKLHQFWHGEFPKL